MGPPSRAPGVITLSIAVLLACLAPASSAPSEAAQQVTSSTVSFDELYRRGYQTGAGIKTLTARFTETTTSSLLTRPLVAHGTLAVQRPSQVALRFADPEQRVVLISGERMTVSWPARNLRQVSNVSSSQNRIQKYLASDSPEELGRQFAIERRSPGERPGTYQFVLTPKSNRIRDTLTRLDLWVDPSSFLLRAIRMTFSNGDTKTMDFEDVVLNAPLDETTFRLDP